MVNYESGVQFLERVNSCDKPLNLFNDWFKDEDHNCKQVLEITGASSTGKTYVLMDLISKCILPLEAGGLNSKAIFISNDQNFDIIQLMEICYSKNQSINFNQVLANLFIIENFDEIQLKLSVYTVDRLIRSLKNVSLVAIDDVLAFYWLNRCYKSFINTIPYTNDFIMQLKEICTLTNTSIAYTKPDLKKEIRTNDCLTDKEKVIDKRIILRRNGSQFEAECQTLTGVETKKFTINKELHFCTENND